MNFFKTDNGEPIPPQNPRAFLSACRDLVGDTYLIKLFCIKGVRSLQRWVAKRPYVSEEAVRENYLEKHERLLEHLSNQPGGLDVARAIVARHAQLVGCELKCSECPEPDKDTIEEECLDDYPPLTHFHSAIRQGEKPEVVFYLLKKAKREMDETYEKYKQKQK